LGKYNTFEKYEKINQINLIVYSMDMGMYMGIDMGMDINVIKTLEEIANANFASKSIDINSVIHAPSNHDTLFIQIYNNEIYTRSPISEERHHQVLRQIKSVVGKFAVPNCVFAYSTRDEYPNKGDFVFTHAIRKRENTNNILAPCFTFDSYPEKEPTNFISYETTYNELTAVGKSSCMDKIIWLDTKNPILSFVGSIHQYNYRNVNTNFSSSIKDIINIDIRNLDAASGSRFISRADLVNYRYLLHLNGNNGAYASRLKYLLLVASLVIYIPNFRGCYDYQIEYWMNHPSFETCIVECKTIEECEKYIKNAETNPNQMDTSYNTSLQGFNYVRQILKPENVLLYWKILFEKYSAIIKNPINDLIYHHKY